ncbi:gag/pol/env polyprotein, putative [Perkinsus marinus ATCC 50983]|uniref:Gag/pol/env polyprotein, putative n=1 Tax=Perkinsus marinus (strain ATCC 50983 / TXsc) TaxID=423536 RepID=C5LRY1_PERM5|nr:gag/pol/env polyprotein, putative [Perkinsus marinus ATCC 50983]EER00517.1 gag/pol/env polyprotein, putative [Perkinsus marinus ATCC 50983]|eukprot:XP_002767799.1 gag/pol/env polyprotein, putative [Perkinsus marinus ATCC 50983]
MMICPVVIVDKEGSSCLRRFPDSKVDERYRITLDLRVVNSLSLAYDSANAFVLLPSKNAHNVDTVAAFDTKSYRQSEITALRRLRAVPAHYTTYYKLDLRDAYSSVAIDQSLQRCFGVLSYDDSNQPCYWCYRVLPQGWQWSSLLFGSAMEFMMALIQDRFRDLKIPAVAIHCKDDVIIASCCEKHAARALACAKDCFLEYSFVVNEAKTYGPSTSVTFFGYNLKTGCVTPKPKKEFTQATADLALADWHGNCSRAARLSWLRRWCGIFQCFKAHMNHASMDALHHMQRALSCFQKPENEERVDPGLPDSVVEAFRTLCTMYLQNGVVPLFFGLLEETLGTVVLTDANAKSYAGIILRAVRSTPATEGLQNSVSVPVQFPAASELFSSVPDIPYVLLPVKFVGAPFPPTEQRKSSTYRERYAVLDTVWQGRDVLAGEVVCLVDNANTMKTWSDVQETLHGVLLTKFENLQRCAHRFCWMPRDGAPRWPDLLARSIESCHSTDVGMDTDGDACVIDCEAVTCRTAAAGQQTDDVLCMLPVPSLLRRAFAAWKDNSDLSEQCSIALEPEQARGWLKAVQDTDKQCEKLRVLVGKGLSKFNIDDTGILRIGIKYVLPKRFGPSLAEQVHRSHGHCGAKQTLDIICRDFFCFRIAHSVQKVVSKCYCQYVRARRGPITPPVASLRDTVQVNDRWFMDTVGPLPTSADHDYKHVLSIQDAASSLVIFLPLCSTTTATIIETLESRVFSLLSPPRSITVDNASSFQAVAFQSWAASWGIKVYFNPPYAAHRNGSLERQHGVLKQVLKSLCKGNVAQWPRFLPVAQRRCNSRAIYGDNTPHQLYFGLKDSAFFSRRFEDIAPSLDADSVRFEAKRRSARREADIRRIHQALDEAEAEVLLKLTNSKKIVSRRRVFQVGQKVLKWCGPKPALGVSWSGPHVVTECCGPNKMTYRLSDGTTQESHNLCLYH